MKLRGLSKSATSATTGLAELAGRKSRQPRPRKPKANDQTTTAAGVAVRCRVVFAGISIRNACALTNDEGSRHGGRESRVGSNIGYKSNIATTAEPGMQRCGRTRFQTGRVKLHKRLRSVTRELVDSRARFFDQMSEDDCAGGDEEKDSAED